MSNYIYHGKGPKFKLVKTEFTGKYQITKQKKWWGWKVIDKRPIYNYYFEDGDDNNWTEVTPLGFLHHRRFGYD